MHLGYGQSVKIETKIICLILQYLKFVFLESIQKCLNDLYLVYHKKLQATEIRPKLQIRRLYCLIIETQTKQFNYLYYESDIDVSPVRLGNQCHY